MSDTFDRVAAIVTEHLGVDEDKVTLEANLLDDLGADSLDAVEIVMLMEEEFDIEILDEAAEKLQTVGEIVNFVDEQLTAAA